MLCVVLQLIWSENWRPIICVEIGASNPKHFAFVLVFVLVLELVLVLVLAFVFVFLLVFVFVLMKIGALSSW